MPDPMSQRPGRRVLIVMDAYLPGRLAGGPVTSVANMIEALRGEIEFVVVTRNADLNGELYPDVPLGTPVAVGAASVIYLAGADFRARNILKIAASLQADTLYLNSFFSVRTIRLLLQLSSRRGLFRAVVLAPRGEFSPGALALKAKKKRVYLQLFQRLHLQQVVTTFQASSPLEERDIHRALGPVRVKVAADMPDITAAGPASAAPASARLVFIGRISPMKNLLYSLQLLTTLQQPIEFDIYGPLEDQGYWQQCQRVMATLPPQIKVAYRGVLTHEAVTATFACYTAFLLPTQGENYGHVVLEALSGGCPVILSDRTPWQDLNAYGVGWVCDLDEPSQFRKAVAQVLNESAEEAQKTHALGRSTLRASHGPPAP